MKRTYMKIVTAILLGCMQGISALGCAWLLKIAVDIAAGDNGKYNLREFCIIAMIYYVIYLFVYYFSKTSYADAIRSLRIRIKEQLFEGLLWATERKYKGRPLGKILTVFQYQVDLIEKSFLDPLMSLIKNAAMMLVSVGFMIFIQWKITAGAILFLGLYLWTTKKINKKLEAIQTAVVHTKNEENNELVAMVKGFFTAKDCGQEEYFLSRYSVGAENAAEVSFQCNYAYDVLSIISTNLETMVTVFIVFAGGMMLEAGVSGVSVGGVLGMTQLFSSIIGPAGSMGATIAQIKSTREVRQEMKSFAEDGAEGKSEWAEVSRKLPKLETLSIRNVSFAYEEKAVLEQVSFEFHAGRKYAIVGESGSGKTTLLKLLLKQLEPGSGEIYWNEIPYSEIGKGELLPKLGYVAQEPMVFRKSVRENIVGGTGIVGSDDSERIHQVLKRSSAHLMRDGLPEEDLLELPARELSGGEQKRMAYARALYKDSDVLILDEVTSALDEKTARSLEKDMLQTEGKTVICVTHRLEAERFALYDEVLTVRDGKIAYENGEF